MYSNKSSGGDTQATDGVMTTREMREMEESMQSESCRHVPPASRHAERGHDMQQGRELPWHAPTCPGLPWYALICPGTSCPNCPNCTP
jgi:hypothetical protein